MANDLFFISGPCVVEGEETLFTTAEKLAAIRQEQGLTLYFKASYKKANRSSAGSFSGIGDKEALELLAQAGKKYSMPLLTDIHTPEEAALAANYVDVLQIPAFLCRQTDLLLAAAATGKIVNIKKGQFLAPEDMGKALDKIRQEFPETEVWFTERGTFFGYRDLIVDMRSLVIMRQFGVPVVFDATHSVQQPALTNVSGGKREFIRPLLKAAIATGINGVFFETHPQPEKALSDSATQLPLQEADGLISSSLQLHRACVGLF